MLSVYHTLSGNLELIGFYSIKQGFIRLMDNLYKLSNLS